MRKTVGIGLALFLGPVFVSGCNKDESKPATPSPNVVKPPITPTTSTGVSRDSLPADLKNDAYYYYGLSNERALNRELTRTQGGTTSEPLSGTILSNLISVKDGKAIFDVDLTGALASNGNYQMVLMKDGLYTSKMGDNVFDPPQLELPSPLTVGKKWPSKTSATLRDGRTFSQDMVLKVAANEKVKTKLGTFDSIRIDGTGTWTLDGKNYNVTMKAWHVKNEGQAKVELKLTRSGESAQTLKFEATPASAGG